MPKKDNEIIIELKSVSKSYGFGDAETLALRDFDLTVKRGEFIMIMGPSGCGKTTLLNIIGLLDKPTSGTYEICGKPVSKLSGRKKAQIRAEEIGLIFQSFNLIPNLSVIENVTMPLVYSGKSKTRRLKMADNVLERFQLREREYYMPWQLSGGQQQRVAIARSLINDPSIILADEPTGNLDSRSSHIIMEELKEIHSLGNTIIMVTHNPALTTYATRVINMLDGEIDTDIKTVADRDLPKPGDPERISVRILSNKKKTQTEEPAEKPKMESKTEKTEEPKKVEKSEPKIEKRPLGGTHKTEDKSAKAEKSEEPAEPTPRKRKLKLLPSRKSDKKTKKTSKSKKES